MDKGRDRYFYLITGITLLNYTFHFAVPFSIVLLTRSGLTSAQSAAVQSLFFLISAVIQPYAGHQLGQKKYKGPAGLALLFTLLMGSGYLLSESYPIFILLFILGVFCSLGMAGTLASYCIEGLSSGAEKIHAVQRLYFLQNFAVAASGLVAYFFMDAHFKLLIFLDFATTAIFFSVMLFLLPRVQHSTVPLTPFFHDLNYFFQSKKALLAGVCLICFVMFWGSFLSVMPVLFIQKGLDPVRLGALQTLVNNSIVVLSMSVFARRLANIPERRRLNYGALSGIVCFVAMVYLNSTLAFCFLFAAIGLSEVLAAPAIVTTFLNYFPAEKQGIASGLKMFLIRMGMILMPLLAGLAGIIPTNIFAVILGLIPLVGWIAFIQSKKINS